MMRGGVVIDPPLGVHPRAGGVRDFAVLDAGGEEAADGDVVTAPTWRRVWAGRIEAATEAAATKANLMFMGAPFEAWWMGYWETRIPR